MNPLLKKLKIIKEFEWNCWNFVNTLFKPIDDITNGNMIDFCSITKSEWLDSWKRDNPDMHPLNLLNKTTWSTYDKCVSATISYLNGKFMKCEVTIYDGDNCYGDISKPRLFAEISIPVKFISEFKEHIDAEFDWYCESEYEKHLEKVRLNWINKYKSKVLA